MAEVTILRCGQMVCCRILTRRKLPVMTSFTTIGDTGMVKHPAGKIAGDMAHGTVFRRWNMIRRFANRGRAVMTGGAVIHDASVIKYCR